MLWTCREKVTATVKISRSEKVYNRCEDISCREKFQSPWNLTSRRENLPPREKVTVSAENLLIQRKHFTFPFFQCKSLSNNYIIILYLWQCKFQRFSAGVYKLWKLHVIHCYLIATFFLLNMQIHVFFFIL